MGSPQGYRASWWTFLLHQAPHINFQFEAVGSEFAPEDWGYQQGFSSIGEWIPLAQMNLGDYGMANSDFWDCRNQCQLWF
ncbi:UNVERIFIED_CONTAM: hypothetical protein K2H54_038527 [Gekko kuhli]